MSTKKTIKKICQARTSSGARCRRNAAGAGAFCKQHSEVLEDSLWAHPGGKLDYVPDPPKLLSEEAAGFWNQYCTLLMETGMLKGVYLGDMHELCWRIDYRKELEDNLDRYGLVNEYEGSNQLNGIDKTLDRNDKRITVLKKQFGLTLDTAHRLKQEKPKAGESKQKPEPGKLRRVAKGF